MARPKIRGSRSDTIVSLLKERHGVEQFGFRNRIRKMFGDDSDVTLSATFIPDAFLIRAEDREIDLFEIVEFSPIRPDKGNQIGLFGEECLDEGWEVRVVVYDYVGNKVAELPSWVYLTHFIGWLAPNPTNDATAAAMAIYRELQEGERAEQAESPSPLAVNGG